MGVEDYLLGSSLIGILAQRLVRVNCKECKRVENVPAALLQEATFDVTGQADTIELQKGPGCQHCDYTGYESRIGIFELLDINDSMRQLIVKTADATVLKAEAIRCGMRTLKQDGWNKVLAGITTPDEVLRVTQEV
jgi:type II secretory ATPase GspE/PulE/Tfp pilus assembly ATPase PilB-like protein